MSDLYSIGLSGVRAYQGALSTVSENIANAQTPGYAKRVTTLQEFGTTAGGTTGSGVRVAGTYRTADLYRAADVRRAGSDLARTETSVSWLERVETALSADQVGQRITGFFNAATTLAADPSAATPRAQMIEAGRQVAYAFSATGRSLDALTTELHASTGDAVATLNGLAGALAKVNDQLARAPAGTATNVLASDSRDQLLEQMSAIADTNVTIDALGRASVRLGGATGPTLVAPDGAGTLSAAVGDTGSYAFAVDRGGEQSAYAPAGGTLGGIADTAQRIADTRTTLGQLATDFAGAANAFQAAGRTLDGTPGTAFFTVAAGDATQLSLALEDPRGIAAAAPGGGVRDNANLLSLAAVRTTAGYEGRATTLVGGNATALASARTVATAQSAIRDGAVTRYDATAGVDLDNEAVDLMRYQQAYQGCSRVIQVGRECFQSLLDAT